MGIPRKYAEHKLHIRKDANPVRQPLRRFSEEKRRTIGEEVAKLLAAGFIMEVFHPEHPERFAVIGANLNSK